MNKVGTTNYYRLKTTRL